jgi:hypothetical protein
MMLPGTKAEIKSSDFEADKILLLKYKIKLENKEKVNAMFNTHENCRVWIDGKYAFGRESGRMAPSFHRVPVNQQTIVELEAGEHELLVGLAPSSGREKIEWVTGIGNASTKQWLPKVFV